LPRYDYQCTSCGHEFELTQSFKEAGSGDCPECSGEGRRVYHAVPVIYKGSGFYTTDYGRPKAPVESSKDGKDSSNGSSPKATEAKSESTVKTASESSA
jgi:putative FmdB family regulatory protein